MMSGLNYKKVFVCSRALVHDIVSAPPEYLYFAGRKAEGRKVSFNCDFILYTNDATGHDMKYLS